MAIASNSVQLNGPAATPAGYTVSHVTIWTATTGGTLVGQSPLDTARTLAVGGRLVFPIGDLEVEIATGEGTAAGARLAIEAVMGQGTGTSLYVQMHSAAPGTAGTSNVITGNGAARFEWAKSNITYTN